MRSLLWFPPALAYTARGRQKLLPERRNFPLAGTYFPMHPPIRPARVPGQALRPDRSLEEEHMKFTQRMRTSSRTTRVLGLAAGTALLGVAAVGVVDATASHARRPPAATLAALSHPRLAPGSAVKAGRLPTRSRSDLARKQARSRRPGRAGEPAREGRVISAGIRAAGGEVVFYGVRIHSRQLPGVTFGIMAGRRDSAGGLTPEVETNETQGSASSAGFHAVEAASSVGSPAVAIPEFGYYAGPAATITARAGGRQVQAHLARWSANSRIVIFWFTPSTGNAPHNLTAYNMAGHKLPAGHSTSGHG
jgi:hypothetical protein